MKKILKITAMMLVPAAMAYSQQQRIVMNGGSIVVNGGNKSNPAYIVVDDSNSNAITYNSGWISSENEFNMVKWDIGSNTGSFVVPFGDSSIAYLPLTVGISTAGNTGGNIKFATFHTPALNTAALPSDVTNITPFVLPGSPSITDNSYQAADRFYIIDAGSYTSKPSANNIIFNYIHSGKHVEVGAPNTLKEGNLMGERFNDNTATWNDFFTNGCTDAINNSTGSVQTGPVNNANFFRSWTLIDNNGALPLQISTGNVKCGSGNGTATVVAYGGQQPYYYKWSDNQAQTVAVATGLTAGSYTVSVTDSHGCVSSTSITLTSPSNIVVNASVTNEVTCYGGSNGSAQSNPTGGVSPYSFAWSNADVSSAVSGLATGGYTVTVTDNNGCSATAAVTLLSPTQLLPNATVIANVGCNGGSSGIAQSVPAGGVSPYQFSWSNGATTSLINSLTAGVYSLTLTDNNGCDVTASITISAAGSLAANVAITSEVTCNGGNNGGAQSSPTGGSSPYTYLWSNAAVTPAIINLTAGAYLLTLMDNNGCSVTASVTITSPTALAANASVLANDNCFAGNNGSAQSSPTGGVTPYTFLWSNSMVTSSITALTASSYSVTVTDNNGCISTASITITSPALIVPNASVVNNASCFGVSNGVATSVPNGGVTPYTFAWSSGQKTSNISGLSAGNYTVTISDAQGCSQTASITITQSAQLAVSINITQITCFNANNGSGTAVVTGGQTPYKYSWTGGATSQTASGLTIGNYTVKVTDANGCQGTASTTVTQPTVLALSLTPSASACSGTGSIASNVTGGTPAYKYLWSDANHQTVSTATGLTAGAYTLTLSDANGCTATASASVTQSAQVVATISKITNVLCFGGATGNVRVVASGGKTPYKYEWSNSNTNSEDLNLIAGTYTITVTDNNGCSATAAGTVTQPASAVYDSIVNYTNVTCLYAANACASVGANGGTTPYAFYWSNGATTTQICNINAGAYQCRVTDGNGCTNLVNLTISHPAALTVTLTLTNVTCYSQSNGSVAAAAGGGTSPYKYKWSNGSQLARINTLPAKNYTVTVTDANGCTVSASTAITQPLRLRDSVVTNACVNNYGQVTVEALGGTPNYAYSWAPSGGTKATASSLGNGKYTITVTDSKGCTGTVSVSVSCPESLPDPKNNNNGAVACCDPNVLNDDGIELYPNPNRGEFTITGVKAATNVELYNALGQLLRTVRSSEELTMQINISDLPDGMYLVRIVSDDGSFVTQKRVIKQ